VANGIYFFGNMTIYIGMLAALRKTMVQEIVVELQEVSWSRTCSSAITKSP